MFNLTQTRVPISQNLQNLQDSRHTKNTNCSLIDEDYLVLSQFPNEKGPSEVKKLVMYVNEGLKHSNSQTE